MQKFKAILLTALIALMAACTVTYKTSNEATSGEATSGEATSGEATSGEAADDPAARFTVDGIGITYVQSPLNVPSIVERQQGMFADAFGEYGVDVVYSTLTTGPDQVAALASGDIHFLFAVGGTSVLQAAAGGLDIRVISMYSRAPEAFMLFANAPDITGPADLAGKTVAGPLGTILHQMLVAYLHEGGLTMADIDFIQMDIAESQAALEAGAVDLALLAGPAAFNSQAGGAHVVTDGEGLIDGTILVAVTERFYEANPRLVELFVETQREILAFMAENHDLSMELTAAETGLPLEAVEAMFPMYEFDYRVLDSDIRALEATMEFLLATDMMDGVVDVGGLVLSVG